MIIYGVSVSKGLHLNLHNVNLLRGEAGSLLYHSMELASKYYSVQVHVDTSVVLTPYLFL